MQKKRPVVAVGSARRARSCGRSDFCNMNSGLSVGEECGLNHFVPQNADNARARVLAVSTLDEN